MLKPLFKVALGGRLGNGRQYMPWIHIEDQIAAIRHLVEHDEVSGPVNICSPNPVTNADFTAAFGRAVRRPAPWFAPTPAIKLAVGDADGETLYSQRMVPTVLSANGFTHRHPALDETLSSLLK
jgi:NAD dependent epimerase/dehydratase family enzyme